MMSRHSAGRVLMSHALVCLYLIGVQVRGQGQNNHGVYEQNEQIKATTYDDVIQWLNDNRGSDEHENVRKYAQNVNMDTNFEEDENRMKENFDKRNRDANHLSPNYKSPDFLRLETWVQRLEHQLRSQGHTLAGHWDRLAAQHGLLVKQAETGQQYLTKLSHLEREVDIQKGRIDRVMVDNHWQEVKLKVMDNNTAALRYGIRQMDTTIQSLYADHGFFYRQLEELSGQLLDAQTALKRAESRTNLLENSLRYLIYMKSVQSLNVSVVEDSVKWLRNKPKGKTENEVNMDYDPSLPTNMILEPESFARLTMTEMNNTLNKLAQRSSSQQNQLDEMSLDLEQLKDEVFTFYKYLEATQDRLRHMQPYNMTNRQGGAQTQALSEHTVRFLMGKVEELQKEVGNLKRVFMERTGIDLRTLGEDPAMTATPTSDSLVMVEDVVSQEKIDHGDSQEYYIEKVNRMTPTSTPAYLTKAENKNTAVRYISTTESYQESLEEELMNKAKAQTQPNESQQASILPSRGYSEVGRNLKGANQKGNDLQKENSRSKGRHKVRHLYNASAPPLFVTALMTSARPTTMSTVKGPPSGHKSNYKTSKVSSTPREKIKDLEENSTEQKAKDKNKTKNWKVKNKGPSSSWSAEMLNVHPSDVDVCLMWGLRIGRPRNVTEIFRAYSGTWMRDSRSRDDFIYVLKGSLKVNNMRQYVDENALVAGNTSMVYNMPFRCTGTGHVVYNGSLYCNKYMSNRLMKYDLETKQVVSRRLKDAGFNNTYPYSCHAHTDMDFAVDEVGLWLIYSKTGNIIINKINPHTLETQQEWETSFPKIEALNSFMVCGRLYVVGVEGQQTGVVYIYDTKSSRDHTLPVANTPIQRSGYMTMLDYNPKDAKLYAWQMTKNFTGEIVIYDVYFKNNLL